jgi:hypothetical protein
MEQELMVDRDLVQLKQGLGYLRMMRMAFYDYGLDF